MKFENTEVWGFNHAIRGMRQPMNSHDKSDSVDCSRCDTDNVDSCPYTKPYYKCFGSKDFIIGKNDLALMQKLIRAGSEHRKFMRMIMVSVDIIAPMFWLAELDTYKVGVTRNSSSFMHKGVAKEFELADFDCDSVEETGETESLSEMIKILNNLREKYIETTDYNYFRAIRQLLPSSYLYRSTVTMNYENIYNMIHQRKNHRLKEWSEDFISWAKTLPYADELLFIKKEVD